MYFVEKILHTLSQRDVLKGAKVELHMRLKVFNTAMLKHSEKVYFFMIKFFLMGIKSIKKW